MARIDDDGNELYKSRFYLIHIPWQSLNLPKNISIIVLPSTWGLGTVIFVKQSWLLEKI